jgi:hypothetical protein
MKWIVKKGMGRPNGRKPLCQKNLEEKDKGRNKFYGGSPRVEKKYSGGANSQGIS